MAALSERLPTFGESQPVGAFSQDALRRALAPALPKPASPSSGAGAPTDPVVGASHGAPSSFKPLTAMAWKRASRQQPASQPERHTQSEDDPAHTRQTGSDAQLGAPRPAGTFAASIPHFGGVSPKQAEVAKIETAVARAQAEAAQAHAEALEAVRQAERVRAEERIAEARQQWAEHEAQFLHTALAGIKDEIMTQLGDAVGEVLAPIFSDVCTHRALAEFHTALAPLMGDTAPPLVEITAPTDLVDALRERLGEASHVRLTASDTPTLRAVTDVTVVETSLKRWSEGLSPTDHREPLHGELRHVDPTPDDADTLPRQPDDPAAYTIADIATDIVAEEPAPPPEEPDQPVPTAKEAALKDEAATPHADIIAQEPLAVTTPDTSTADAPAASGDNDTSEER